MNESANFNTTLPPSLNETSSGEPLGATNNNTSINTNSCFQVEPLGRPNCNDTQCLELVCNQQSSCCDEAYDGTCVEFARLFCTAPPQEEQASPTTSPRQQQIPSQPPQSSQQPFQSQQQQPQQHGDDDLPENHCYQTSPLPGCSDQTCLEESVCLQLPECCNVAYSAACIEIARTHHTSTCPPPPIDPPNACLLEANPFLGGCLDKRCAKLVCDVQEDCCNAHNTLGRWHEGCVQIAQQLCQPPVFKRPPGQPCPAGFTCSDSDMANCTELQSTAKDIFQMGNVYAGIYCGDVDLEDGHNLKNCDVGMYCPTPELRLPCPAGYFCPHKTAIPDIECRQCPEGSPTLQRDVFGFVTLLVVGGLIVFYYIMTKLVMRHPKTLTEKLQQRRRLFPYGFFQEMVEYHVPDFGLLNSLSSSNASNSHNKKKSAHQKYEKLRHKIDLINKRVALLQQEKEDKHKDENAVENENNPTTTTTYGSKKENNNNKNNNNSVGFLNGSQTFFRSLRQSFTPQSSSDPDGNAQKRHRKKRVQDVRFNPRLVFDVLDAKSEGEIAYQELNRLLGLNEVELQEFIRRMNQLAGSNNRSNPYVKRTIFIKYFLRVLKETSNLTVSYEEAEVLFDEMATIKNQSTTPIIQNSIHMSVFYNSSMSDFLSDYQICNLIRRFERINIENGNTKRPSSNFGSENNVSSLFQLPVTMSRRSLARQRSNRSQGSGGQANNNSTNGTSRMVISREIFVERYPELLLELTMENHETSSGVGGDEEHGQETSAGWQYPGVDICFRDLSLNIQIGGETIQVVDKVTGRIRAKTMTALMGGSGAGKTSLLNALCGRAFYGYVTGSVFLNGHETKSIEHFKDSIGFVPQDDIVYPELTVRENLVYAGRFRLPDGTSDVEIEDLAETTMANLGLSRVAENLVGDVRKRGISGGERKRVNIGLELMANPAILFLDEPTSGLDASSALLVMKSLKHLVEKDGVTVVSVIHQPRKFIYDLFESVILLGIGGKTVYHGPSDLAVSYFNRLHYALPEGESVADWLIDISSGRLEPEIQIEELRKKKPEAAREQSPGPDSAEKVPADSDTAENGVDGQNPTKQTTLAVGTGPSDANSLVLDTSTMENAGETPVDENDVEETHQTEADDIEDGRDTNPRLADPKTSHPTSAPVQSSSLYNESSKESLKPQTSDNGDLELREKGLSLTSEATDSESIGRKSSTSDDGSFNIEEVFEEQSQQTLFSRTSSIGEMSLSAGLNAAARGVTDEDCVGARGVTTGKVVQAAQEAKKRRTWLYEEWSAYFDNMESNNKKLYEVPDAYPLPTGVKKPSFFYQLHYQTQRIFIVAWRNRRSKFIDSLIIVGSLIVITALEGVAVVSEDLDPDVAFEIMVRPNRNDRKELFKGLFQFAQSRQIQYALKAGIVICALVGLTATKVLTEKRLLFFREAASGYNLDAYYVAVNIMATTEHTVQALIGAFFAIWIRNPLASAGSFVVHFVLLVWVVVSWSLLIPMVTPPETVMIAGAFFFVFCALMFSGVFPPILYQEIYEEGGLFQEVFAGWIGATRFFFEAITVGEYRCLPEQTGYTISEEAVNRAWNSSAILVLGYAGHDPSVVRKSCFGWYWSVIPAILVGITVRYAAWLCMYGFQRGEQTKKPLWSVMKSDVKVFKNVLLYVAMLAGLFALTTWTFVRDASAEVTN